MSDKVNNIKDIEMGITSGEKLAGVLGITSRRIRQLAGEGHITKDPNGKYEYPKAVREYCDYLRDKAKGGDIDELKIRNMQIKCDLNEQKLAWKRREIAEDVANECWDIFLDALSPMKMELVRMNLPGEIEKEWNGIVERAVEAAYSRKSTRFLDAEPEAAPDSVDPE